MARTIPKDRFEELVRGATEVFIARGYRLTQMSDVAEAIGVAKGTLYGYVESKDALFVLCLLRSDEAGSIELPEVLPLHAPAPGQLGKLVREQVKRAVDQPRLMEAIERDRAEDPRAEATAVLAEFYDLLESHRHRIKLLDRCMDHPELREIWQSAGRQQSRDLFKAWLEKRIAGGQFVGLPSVGLSARFLLESLTTWAVHIHWDRAPESFDRAQSRDEVIDFLVRGLLA